MLPLENVAMSLVREATEDHVNVQGLCPCPLLDGAPWRTDRTSYLRWCSGEKALHLAQIAQWNGPGGRAGAGVEVSQPEGVSVGELTLPPVCHGVAHAQK